MRGTYGEFGEFRPCETKCEAQGLCPFPKPYEDQHHLFFPAPEYRDQIAKKFRAMAENIIDICRCKHDEIHALVEEPQKPPREHMVERIEEGDVHITRGLRRALDKYKRGRG